MTDTNTNSTAAAATQTAANAKPKTVLDMKQRTILSTPEEAENFLTNAAEKFSDFGAFMEAGKVVIPKLDVDEEGNATLNREIYGAEGMGVMIAVMANKNKKENGIKAIVVCPVPTVELAMQTEEGKAFVKAIFEKEMNHRAVRALRDAENVGSVADQIPLTLAEYMASGRESGGLMEAFDELYKQINETLSKAVPAWAKRRFTKLELRKSLESKAYALDSYPEIEEAGVNGSLFEKAIALGISGAKRKSLDPAIFDRWAATRNEKTLTVEDGDDEELELDLDALTESMLSEPAKPATEDGAEQPAEPAASEEAPATA